MWKRQRYGLCFTLLSALMIAGCFSSGPSDRQGANRGKGQNQPGQSQSGPVEHKVMRLPVQLEPTQQQSRSAGPDGAAPRLEAPSENKQAEQFALQLATGLSDLFHDAANRAVPAVVTIRTLSAVNNSSEDDPFASVFGDQGDEEEVRESLGSGVIIDPSGIVLTNYHVIRQKGQTVVELHDGRKFEIAVTRSDPRTDLAVLQLKNASGLPSARLGDSDALKVGDWVLAVGNPFGLEATVTAGIISAKGRGVGASPREKFLQTDAPINPGNSGGQLVNLRGDVVGINTAISSTTGGYQGIGFTIPINLAKDVTRQLIETGHVVWPYLGVGVHELTPELASRLGTGTATGVVVMRVARNSPAATAGIRVGDVLTKFEGRPLSNPRALQSAVDAAAIGAKSTISLIRGGTLLTVSVTIAEHPPAKAPAEAAGEH